MPMTAHEIEVIIRHHLPDAQITIRDLAGDGDHYEAEITSAAFQGKSRVAQHQMVYAAFGDKMGRELHALALKTFATTSI